MWGIIPAAGVGSRIQPLAFSKELLPLQDGLTERPRAVSDYLVERLRVGGADKICFVISPRKSDILEYYGSRVEGAHTCFVVQPRPAGLCDAVFQAAPLIGAEELVLIGLPDTVWFPVDGFLALDRDRLSFLLFPVEEPQHFDAVVTDAGGAVVEIQVKSAEAATHWIWGAFQMPGSVYRELHALWLARGKSDEFIGTLVNEYLRGGGVASAVKAGTSYLDVGTLHGYREALKALEVPA